MRTLTLTAAQLDSAAGLRDDPDVPPILGRARLARNKLFLAAIVQAEPDGAAFDVLVRAQLAAPAAVGRILAHPRFGAWAADCATHEGCPGADRLACFAAAAAIRASVPFDLALPIAGGALVLPTLGAVTGLTGSSLRIRSIGEGNPLAARPDWRTLRLLRAELPCGSVAVEFDEFPFVHADGTSPFPALAEPSPEERDLWQYRFAAAMRLITQAVPELGASLRHGMRSIVPIAATGGGASLATHTDAFGAAAMVLPGSAKSAATALLHEFQHSKLSTLSELVPLVADDAADLYSPWRPEPRPASAVLHGAFAHAAIALLCGRLAGCPRGAAASAAWDEAELARVQTLTACEELIASGRLTGVGRRFVVQLHRSTRRRAAAPGPLARCASATAGMESAP